MSTQSDTKEKDVAWIGYHVVCLIDLLGQKRKLTKWAELPMDQQPSPEFMTALKQTVGTIIAFDDQFKRFFREMGEPQAPQSWIDSLNTRGRELYLRYKDCHLGMQQFGDTFVFYAPLRNTYGDISIIPMYRMLVACCWSMIISLAAGAPLRGAICIGSGMELKKGTFYGPALAEADYLERKVAGYPRIVIAPEAAKFVQEAVGFSNDETMELLMKGAANRCRPLLCDDWGQVIVDFMGEGVFALQDRAQEEIVRAVEKAYRFVCSETDRFRRERDEKHFPRYEWLRQYMETRLPIWIDPKELEHGR